jgi:hypothetical protein
MPKLYKKDSGGYYTRTKSENSFITYQISPKGIEILKTLGFEENDVFDHKTISRLVKDGHAYTCKSGTSISSNDETAPLDPKRKKNPDVFHEEFKLGWIMNSNKEYTEVLFEKEAHFIIKQFQTKDTDKYFVNISKLNKYKSQIHKSMAELIKQKNDGPQKKYREMGNDVKLCQRIGEQAKNAEDRMDYFILSIFLIEKELEKDLYGMFGSLLAVVEKNGYNVKKAQKQLHEIARIRSTLQQTSKEYMSETQLKEKADEIMKLTSSLIEKAGYRLP